MAFVKSKRRRDNARRVASVSDATLKRLGMDRVSLARRMDLIQGQIVFPGDPGYDKDRQEFNQAFQEYPQVIVYCETFSDVQQCLAWAQSQPYWVTCRAGGHSTAGYSVNSGMVIDVSNLSYVQIDPTTNIATVGAGTNFGTLNQVLDANGLHVPGGGCEDVCVAGYMQGGGFGFTSRQFAMNCDNVVSVTVMLADQGIVIANATQNADLFWAIRGGTGNNFGVLLEIDYQCYPLGQLWGFGLLWPVDKAAAALKIMQDQFTTTCPGILGYMTMMTAQPPTNQTMLMMRGIYNGPESECRAALAPLLAAEGEVQIWQGGSYLSLNQYLLEEPYPIPNFPDGAPILEDKQSAYIASPLSLAQWQQIVDYYQTTPKPFNMVVIEPYGGAINDYGGDNAFIHRTAMFDLFVDCFWLDDPGKQAAEQWLNGFMALVGPWSNGESYQNYPRRTLTNYRAMYWGSAFNTLFQVKAKYDPANFFHFQQSISLSTADAGPEVVRDTSKPKFAPSPIVYQQVPPRPRP